MKSFDLTFSGTVLPEHDPGQVKQDLAQLFCIEDRAILDELFCGKTIVLRHNLDRKTAADYFRKMTLLGGQAELVASPKHRSIHSDETSFLEQSLISQTGILAATEHLPNPDPETTLEAAPARIVQTHFQADTDAAELQTLVADITRQSQLVSDRLQQQKDHFNRIAELELEKIAKLDRTNRLASQNALDELKFLKLAAEQSMAEEISNLQQQQSTSREHAEHNIARLEELRDELSADEEATLTRLTQSLEKKRLSTAADIRRLEQILLDTQRQAKQDVALLEQQLGEVHSKTAGKEKELERQKQETLRALEQDIRELEQQKALTKAQFEHQSSELEQRQRDTQKKRKAELSRLRNLKADIEHKRNQNIVDIEQAIIELNRQTEVELQRTQAAQEELHNTQPGSQGNMSEDSQTGAEAQVAS